MFTPRVVTEQLGLTFVVLSAIYTALIALAGGRVARFPNRSPAVKQHASKVVGTIYLLHAGDVVNADILERSQYAPTYAVRGNCDNSGAVTALPPSLRLTFGRWNIFMLHDLHDLNTAPQDESVQIVISGHSHQLLNEDRGGVLYLNPASCGPRRFSLPVSMMRLTLPDSVGDAPQVEIIELL